MKNQKNYCCCETWSNGELCKSTTYYYDKNIVDGQSEAERFEERHENSNTFARLKTFENEESYNKWHNECF